MKPAGEMCVCLRLVLALVLVLELGQARGLLVLLQKRASMWRR